MIQRTLPAYFFSMECVFLYFLLFLFYTRIGETPSILGIITVCVVGNLFLQFGLKQKQVSGSLPFLGAIISGGIGYLFGFTAMSVILCTVFLYFRIGAFIKDSSLWKGERTKLAILFYCSAFVIFMAGWIFKYPYMNWLFGTVILFTLLLSIGRYLQQTIGNKANKNIMGIVGALSIAVILAGFVAILIRPIKWILFTIIEGFFRIIGFLLMPIFNFLEGIILTIQPRINDEEFLPVELGEKKEEISDPNLMVQIPIWVWFVILGVVLFAIWFVLRKRKLVTEIQDQSKTLMIEHIPLSANLSMRERFFRGPAPNEHIRKLIFQLQIYANRYGFGRFEHETVQEWFERIGFQKNEDFFMAYESVRYGTEVITKNDAKYYEEVVQELKREMKERYKKTKEKGEGA
jgi:hypothetical protein